MTPTMTEINIAIVMLAVSIGLLVWFRSSEAGASTRRMMRMMTHVGLKSAIAVHRDPRTKAAMDEARRRCGKCMAEDHCDRWFSGGDDGDESFCPNAKLFRSLAETGGRGG